MIGQEATKAQWRARMRQSRFGRTRKLSDLREGTIKGVAGALLDFVPEVGDNWGFPTQSELARYSGYDVSTVSRVLAALRATGWLSQAGPACRLTLPPRRSSAGRNGRLALVS